MLDRINLFYKMQQVFSKSCSRVQSASLLVEPQVAGHPQVRCATSEALGRRINVASLLIFMRSAFCLQCLVVDLPSLAPAPAPTIGSPTTWK